MSCADCGELEAWVFEDPGALPVRYCDCCLPMILRPRAVAGSLTRVETPARKSKKAASTKE